ncbi:MAG: nitrite reductase large subunit NirB [Hydrogenophaga sp.]|jgi:nitrite reductase (NADH) large subunit|uniref:nitrite reductase large subunit NirB n=1 Tax=Hydrogenophaga sp. TaxID=1904254 RepID=UPI0025BA6B8D|nr:nitrite reductase large subunit NirB [Hydrogenophaga sp.]MBU4182114.1 nitrite reductase large subunit NirB [Gammaproteobacteria bacterium]MBU4280514.1 nitrite reductase large subunit NirB [Gammaproteobacteria bacterium]MBU4322774.1 nitrite reductase large subunit NirB [Gammaproteobacteria bacterium]MCG2654774.1 nitrite reductase large subunit NirB [Hydrogenophaga sp.]MDZ4291525.1 nitrite reductase large subunit NirB [Hydrogenophaga sp.]
MKKSKLVMVGNGMAGVRTLEELLKIAPEFYDITVFGAEPHPNYNRILLSPVLAGEQTLEEIVLNDWSWYTDHGITLHAGYKVTEVDRIKRIVHAVGPNGEKVSAEYDRLIMATGSNPFILPIPGKDLEGVLAYRDIADTQAMIDAATTYKHAVVIGGGLLGLEAANGLMKRGMSVSVVHVAPWLMERQLDDVAGKMLQASLEERGMKFLIGAQTQELVGDKDDGKGGRPDGEGAPSKRRVRAIRFKDGTEVPADLVVMAVGIRPNTALAESMRLHVNKGIVVSDTMQTVTDPRIYAVGECAAHRGIAYGLVAPLFEQGKVLATHLAEFGIGRYTGSLTSTKLKVTGIDLFSAGNFTGGDDTEEIVMSDPSGGVYKKLVIQGDKLIGACLYGDTVDGSWYFKLLRDGRSVADIRDKLMFGESNIGDVGHQGQNKAAAMKDSDEVCGCNGVTKGTICKAIRDKGLFTLDEVKKHTKASASCGSCTGLVEQILMFTAGGDYSATPKLKAMCGCTDHGHEAVREAIRTPLADGSKLQTTAAVFSHLGWKTPNGCASCRPAINYYLISTWPKAAKDDPQSRYINERSHANIQKDGTYSVIPRMWGGETTADELRRIADAVDKYKIPTVKVTGGQRIDLLGVKKEDLVNVWKDIGMPSGHAYAKALRTVKTCVGSEWCRMGTQDSTQMGKDLEKAMWRMYAPHKVKFAVSGCPRNCAEAGIKDVGIIGVDSGWEMYVAGNGGIKTEVAHFFVKLKTAEEVMEYTGAFMELYRTEGWYLERTVHYINRVGLDYVKKRILDDAEGRKALWERLQFALDGEPDPWFDFKEAAVDTRQFIPIKAIINTISEGSAV